MIIVMDVIKLFKNQLSSGEERIKVRNEDIKKFWFKLM